MSTLSFDRLASAAARFFAASRRPGTSAGRRRHAIARTCAALAAGALVAAAPSGPAGAIVGPSALQQADAAYSKIDDYRMTIAVHEIDGSRSQDSTYDVRFKKPTLERVDIVAGPDKGSGLVWLGGDTVKAHRGGFLSAIKVTVNLHSRLVATMRGDSIDMTTVPAMLAHFSATPGSLSEAPGPPINGADTIAVTLDVADPASDRGLTREIIYVCAKTHFPIRCESYVGDQLVKTVTVQDVRTNVGLTAGDFPW